MHHIAGLHGHGFAVGESQLHLAFHDIREHRAAVGAGRKSPALLRPQHDHARTQMRLREFAGQVDAVGGFARNRDMHGLRDPRLAQRGLDEPVHRLLECLAQRKNRQKAGVGHAGLDLLDRCNAHTALGRQIFQRPVPCFTQLPDALPDRTQVIATETALTRRKKRVTLILGLPRGLRRSSFVVRFFPACHFAPICNLVEGLNPTVIVGVSYVNGDIVCVYLKFFTCDLVED
ncbi:hypothetical protein D3C87_831490 [compost metagenome]